MTFENLTVSPSDGMTRVPAFTLATALAWMGHDCGGGCPPLAAQLRASVWTDRSPVLEKSEPTSTMLFVDFGDQAWLGLSADGLVRQVNHCARHDHIEVRQRASWAADAIELGHRDSGLCANGIDHGYALAVPARDHSAHHVV